MKKLIFFALALSSTVTFAATNDIQLGVPAYGGNGCPQGSASAAISPDGKSLSILFDKYIAEAVGDVRVDRKSCNIAIPVHVPQGYSIALFQMDYRGFNALPAGGSSRLNVEYFFAGQKGPVSSRLFRGYLNQDYLVRDTVGAQTLVWSACGAQTNLRINSSIMAMTNSRGDQTMATVDSADIKSGLLYHIQWKRCN